MNKSKIDKRKIEIINSLGPFNHGSSWEAAGLKITNEEGLEGRAHFMVKLVRNIIWRNFTKAEIRKMSIVDVGCYDGWILHQLSDISFARLVGIEPRNKNIQKGKKIRELLGIKTRVRFKRGSIETLGRGKYDIVLCLGTLHHVESIGTAIKKLDSICAKMLILDTICLPSKYITKAFKKEMEMKDVLYQYKEKICGMFGQKYESSYYNGSSAKTTIVSVPSTETLIMHLNLFGYGPIKVEATPDDFRRAMKKNTRSFSEVLLYGIKKNKEVTKFIVGKYLRDYEKGLIEMILDPTTILQLYDYYCLGKKNVDVSPITKAIIKYIDLPVEMPHLLKEKFKDKYQFETVKNMRFNPLEKVSFEYGKLLFSEKKHSDAIKVLQTITQKLNADWRSVYRSFYLLSQIYKEIGLKKESERYKKLCLISNSKFPIGLKY